MAVYLGSNKVVFKGGTFNTGSTAINNQNKTVTPTTSQQTVTCDSEYTGLGIVTVNRIPTNYIIPSGNKEIITNGTGIDVTAYATVSVAVPGGESSSMNVQGYHGMAYSQQASLTATSVSLTVAKTGTYKVSWMGFRNTTSGTSSSQLYIGTTAYGSENSTFTSSYGQSVTLTDVSLTAGQTITVYARARSTSYYMYVGNLIIEQTA